MTAPRDPLAEAVRAFFDGRRDRLPAAAMLARINAMGAALASRPPETDSGSEYGRLLAERDRLIGNGVSPTDLDIPVSPETADPPRTCVFCSGPDQAGPCLGGDKCMAETADAGALDAPIPEPEHTRLMDYRPPLDDIKARDAQTEPTPDRALPLGYGGTIYDHARRPTSTYHLDSPDVAMGDRHVLLDLLRRDATPALDVKRVKRAVTAVAVRHGVVKDPPAVPWSLMHLYGYTTTPTIMDAEIAAAYAAESPTPEGEGS